MGERVILVVICLKICTFVVSKTTGIVVYYWCTRL